MQLCAYSRIYAPCIHVMHRNGGNFFSHYSFVRWSCEVLFNAIPILSTIFIELVGVCYWHFSCDFPVARNTGKVSLTYMPI